MNAYPLPPQFAEPLPVEVADKISQYVPKVLAAEQWRMAGREWTILVARAQPTTTQDAKALLSFACQFLAWAWPLAGSYDPGYLLTTDWISRYTVGLRDQGKHRSATVRRSGLNRLKAVQHPSDAGAPMTKESIAPYTDDDLAKLVALAATETRWAAVEDGLRADPPLDPGPPEDPARRAFALKAKALGIRLDRARVRATYVQRVLTRRSPLAALIGEYELGYQDLNNAANFVALPEPAQIAQLLRG